MLLLPFLHSAFAADCEPNNLGGSFCINDDGSVSSSVPNEVGGTDTYSSGGGWQSTIADDAGADEELSGSSIDTDPSTDASPTQTDTQLKGRDWNAPSNITSDGSATSSMKMLEQQ